MCLFYMCGRGTIEAKEAFSSFHLVGGLDYSEPLPPNLCFFNDQGRVTIQGNSSFIF